MGDKKKHLPGLDLKLGHTVVKKNTEGGACLTGHASYYAENSCSYWWQAHKAAIEREKKKYGFFKHGGYLLPNLLNWFCKLLTIFEEFLLLFVL